MVKELQNRAWSCLPKEFKEEVKYEYRRVTTKALKTNYDLGFINAHEGMYGIHNLTSDAEGEEMLTCEKSKVQTFYKDVNECLQNAIKELGVHNVYTMQFRGILSSIKDLFGSKCLPDGANSQNLSNLDKIGKDCIVDSSEPKPAEPLSQNPPENCDNGNRISDGNNYSHKSPDTCKCPNNVQKNNTDLGHLSKSSSNFDKQFDTILKDSFAKGLRLNVAVQMIKAMIGCPEIVDRISSAETDSLLDDILHDALYLTDKLIAECEKGGVQ